jgi:protein-S-isoprenylcysteine O-methyltransferase Ste14
VPVSLRTLRGAGPAGTRDYDEGIALPPIRATMPERRAAAVDPFDLAAKALIVSLFTLLAVRIAADVRETGRLTGVLLLASESLVVVLTMFRRSAGLVDRSVRARLLTGVSTLGPPLVRPSLLAPWLPGAATVAISAIGLAIVCAGKLSIGRSFGLLPANRGIVSSGLYRVLRHPIYAGYVITHVAFVAANPTPWNAAMLIAADTALLRRAVCEEETLARDPEYKAYMQRVRWRVAPGLF